MLFFLPEPNRKMIRYYGIYANRIKEKLEFIEQRTWRRRLRIALKQNHKTALTVLKKIP
ncbi:MAG: hypothetical protein IPQ05_23620 [Leptospiraceae bacterium]|nr:hypothetical protein [Leptospiraceae bacterium]